MGFNSAFKGLNIYIYISVNSHFLTDIYIYIYIYIYICLSVRKCEFSHSDQAVGRQLKRKGFRNAVLEK